MILFKDVRSTVEPSRKVETPTMVDLNSNIRQEEASDGNNGKTLMWVCNTLRFESWKEYADHSIVFLGEKSEEVQSAASIVFVTMATNEQIDNVTITEHAGMFPKWDENWRGKAGEIVRDEGKLYRSIHDVKDVGQNRKPLENPSMWTVVGNPAEEYPDWSQPLGTHNAYKAGAKVTHKSKKWLNKHGNGNIWEPAVYGWEEAM